MIIKAKDAQVGQRMQMVVSKINGLEIVAYPTIAGVELLTEEVVIELDFDLVSFISGHLEVCLDSDYTIEVEV